MMDIGLKTIERDTSIQCRASIDVATVNEYAERMTEGDEFPPVVLFATNGKHWVGDGWHRLLAAEHIGALTIPAEVRKGGRVEALKHALGANVAHGHRRTNADKRRCVEIALREFPKLSSRAIAEMCGVSPDLVDRTRPEALPESGNATRTTKDGRQYPAQRVPLSVGTIDVEVSARDRIVGELRKSSELEVALEQARQSAAMSVRHVSMWPSVLAKLSAVVDEIEAPGIPPQPSIETLQKAVAAVQLITDFLRTQGVKLNEHDNNHHQ